VKITLGIDIGATTVKIVGFDKDEIICPMRFANTEPNKSAIDAFDSFIEKAGILLSDIEKIVLTGVGASYFNEGIYSVKTYIADELFCIGNGAMYVTDEKSAFVASVGTGTCFIKADKKGFKHCGGSGVGGGTIRGLSKLILDKDDFDEALHLANAGKLHNVDLFIGDISKKNVGSMGSEITASNFGNIKETANSSDIALGIFNMVFQTVGMLAKFCFEAETPESITVIGSTVENDVAKLCFKAFSEFTGIEYNIPEKAAFVTAIGAAIAQEDELTEI